MTEYPEWYSRVVASACDTTPEAIQAIDDREQIKLVFGSNKAVTEDNDATRNWL